MTDLKNMSVDELINSICLTPLHKAGLLALKEMSRRLREQEQQRDYFKGAWNRAIETGRELIKVEKASADQAESALLACQAREAELMGAITKAASFLDEKDVRLPMTGREAAALATLLSVLSHSTGSKIMAVVEAERWIPVSEKLPLPYIRVLVANRTPDGYQVLIGFRNHNGDWKEPWGDNINLDIPMVDFWKHKRPPTLEAKHE